MNGSLIKKLKNLLIGALIITNCTAFAGCNTDSKTKDTPKKTLYKIDVDFNEKEKLIIASQKVTFVNNYSNELKNIVFHLYADSYNKLSTMSDTTAFTVDKILEKEPSRKVDDLLGDIEIKNVLINNKGRSFSQDNQVLKIILDKPLEMGKTLDINIDFTLKIPYGRQTLSYYNDIYSITIWHPILSICNNTDNTWRENPYPRTGEAEYSEVANYEVKIKVPEDMTIATTGTQVEKIENNEKIVTIKANDARDFVFFASNKFKVMSKEHDGIMVYNYYVDSENPEKEKIVERILDESIKALEFFSKKFGKYSYPQFTIVETTDIPFDMEHVSLIQMHAYPRNIESLDKESAFRGLIHEIAHEWWYCMVGSDSFTEAVLDESFANFSRAYYYNEIYGKEHSAALKGSIILPNYEYDNLLKKGRINRPVNSFKHAGDYRSYAYGRGPILLLDLKVKVGDEKFDTIMQNYFKEYKFKNADVNGFLNIIEKEVGTDIRDYMDKAFNKPNYSPTHLYPNNK